MRAIIVLALALLVISVSTAFFIGGCSGANDTGAAIDNQDITKATGAGDQKQGIISPVWLDSAAIELADNTLSISTSEVDSAKMLHFAFNSGQNDTMNFMAYNFNGNTYVRANVCPPCRSTGFSLDGDNLVCNNCGTRFKAGTGDGVSGACRNYPKAEITYTISDGYLHLDTGDLLTAYLNTVKPGWP